jgi:divalent metal cation (Fe/Co/Zn/Cd) transporter
MRQAAGRQFADVVIRVSPGAAVGQGHAAADRVEEAVQRALPESDVVVHVEPLGDDAAIRERAHAAALGVPRVREIHNLAVVDMGGRNELSLHLKLPGDLPLEEAHEVAEEVERAICAAVPEIDAVQTHLEPLSEPTAAAEVSLDHSTIARIVREATGLDPREIRFLRTTEGLVAFLTLRIDPTVTLAEAHARASDVEERIRHRVPEIADVIVHTEP